METKKYFGAPVFSIATQKIGVSCNIFLTDSYLATFYLVFNGFIWYLRELKNPINIAFIGFCYFLLLYSQRGRDSNPRYVAVYTLSKRAPSSTRPPL